MTAAARTRTPRSCNTSWVTAREVPVVATSSTRITGCGQGRLRKLAATSCSRPERPCVCWASPPSRRHSNRNARIPRERAARRASVHMWSMPRRRTAAGREGTGTRTAWDGGWQAATATANRWDSSRARSHAPSSLNAGMSRISSGRYELAAQAGIRSLLRNSRCGCLPASWASQDEQQATAGAPHTRQQEPSSKGANS